MLSMQWQTLRLENQFVTQQIDWLIEKSWWYLYARGVFHVGAAIITVVYTDLWYLVWFDAGFLTWEETRRMPYNWFKF